jgi:chromosome segregation ATPase
MNDATLTRRDRRHRRLGTGLLVAAIVLLVVAIGAGAAAFVVRSDTSDVQARTEPIRRQVRRLAANEVNAERRLHALRTRSADAATRLAGLLAAYQAQVDASNHAVDVANQAVDQYNSGQAAVAAAFQAAGDAAIADLEQKTATVTAAVAAAQREITALSQVSGG